MRIAFQRIYSDIPPTYRGTYSGAFSELIAAAVRIFEVKDKRQKGSGEDS
jgi:hypothetical protein